MPVHRALMAGPKKKYSTDANLSGLSHEAEDLESIEVRASRSMDSRAFHTILHGHATWAFWEPLWRTSQIGLPAGLPIIDAQRQKYWPCSVSFPWLGLLRRR